MRPRVLIIYTLDSIPTTVSAEAARVVHEILNKKCEVHELAVINANNLALRFVTFFNKYDAIFYFGHGAKDKLHGQLPFGLIRAMITTHDLFIRTRIMYAVACLSAQILGPVLVQHGVVKAYSGNDYYTFIAYPSHEHNYMADFIDCFAEFARVLVDGGTVGEAQLKMIRKMESYIRLYRNMINEWPNADFYLYAMKMNREGWRLIGDPHATLL